MVVKNLSLSEQIMYSTARIECYLNGRMVSTGSGFFFRFDFDEGHVPVIVTNKHVITGVDKVKIKFTQSDENGNPVNTEHFDWTVDNLQNILINHPSTEVDLCVIPFADALYQAQRNSKTIFYRTLDKSIIPSSDRLNDEITAIEDITMIGYPNGLWDSINNFPIIRKGITATHPNINHNGKEEFVIDAACFPGSSGSPVLILNENGYTDKKGNTYLGETRVLLMGILYAGPQITTTGDVRVVDIPTDTRPIAVTNLMMNLGYVIKSNKLLDFENLLKSRL